MGLATQAESLPKLRDKLLGIVNEINLVLNENRNQKAPRSPFMGAGKQPARPAGTRKKKQPKATFLDEMPDGAMNVKGIHHSYYFVPGVGMLSLVKDGRVRLLITPAERASWTVKNSKGERMFIGRASLQQKLGMELGL